MEGLHFRRNAEDNLVGMGVLGLCPWVATGERQPGPSEEAGGGCAAATAWLGGTAKAVVSGAAMG